MRVERYTDEKHRQLLEGWYAERKFPAPNPKFLPPLGAVIFEMEKPVCAGFIFGSDANTAIIGHLVSDPAASAISRHECLDFLINELIHVAKEIGFEMVCCSTNLASLMPRFERHGFVKTDENVSNFGRVL